MATHAYNTRFSLIKAGRIINTRLTISLIMIWSALVTASVFLFINNAGLSLTSENTGSKGGMQILKKGETEKQTNEGAFVLVVRNKKVTLTSYTAYTDNNQEGKELPEQHIVTGTGKNTTAVVRHIKSSNGKKEKQPDFSVKKVPF